MHLLLDTRTGGIGGAAGEIEGIEGADRRQGQEECGGDGAIPTGAPRNSVEQPTPEQAGEGPLDGKAAPRQPGEQERSKHDPGQAGAQIGKKCGKPGGGTPQKSDQQQRHYPDDRDRFQPHHQFDRNQHQPFVQGEGQLTHLRGGDHAVVQILRQVGGADGGIADRKTGAPGHLVGGYARSAQDRQDQAAVADDLGQTG